jgi:hypothetical protein
MYYLQYNTDGKILVTGFNSIDHIPFGALTSDVPYENISILQNGFYITNGILTPRPLQTVIIDKSNLLADGIDKVTFSNVEINSNITIRNNLTKEEISATIAGTDTFSTNIIGIYDVTIKCWPYQDKGFTLNAS